MDETAFRTVCDRLITTGRHVRASRFDEASFGSWIVELDGPRQRIVWDGKERTFALQSKACLGEWTDDWVSTEGADLTIDAVLRHLKSA